MESEEYSVTLLIVMTMMMIEKGERIGVKMCNS